MNAKIKNIVIALFLCSASVLHAQKMSVETFERIDRDMGARVAKVRDVNGELCALLKIETIETGFEFSGCSIEKTEQKSGEIWVFVSPGVRFLTIKHKEFGVLRNYEFPQSIESGVVYQMKMKLNAEGKEMKMDTTKVADMIDKKMEELNRKLAELEQKQKQMEAQTDIKSKPNKKKEKEKEAQERREARLRLPEETFLMLNAAYSVAPQTSVGITFGKQKIWGWYVSVASGLSFAALNTQYEDEYGTGSIFYTGEQTSSRLSLHAGVMYRVAKPMSLKVGVGYGIRNLAYGKSNNDYVKITDASYNGPEYSAGVHFSFGRLLLSVDVLGVGTSFEYSEVKLGIGYNLKIKKQEKNKGE